MDALANGPGTGTPGAASGRVTRSAVVNRPFPSEREACSSSRGTASNAAFAVTTTNGDATNVWASTTPRNER